MNERMKVAILGNMNNSYYALARYLRDAGFPTTLYQLSGEPKHFTPVHDTYNEEYKKFTVFLKWGSVNQLLHTSAKKIRNEFEKYDFLIGSGMAPAYLNKAGLTLDLFFVYGWDLYRAPFLRIHNPIFTIQYFHSLYHQRAGIRKSKHMTVGDSAPFFDQLLARLGFSGKRHNFGSPAIYEPEYNITTIKNHYPHSTTYQIYKKIRNDHDFIVFHNTRQIWKTTSNPVAIKNNDQLFKAFKRFKDSTKLNVALIAFEYGVDVIASKKLCQELGIDKNVFWMPLSPRKELMIGMSLVDLVAGEFKNSWFSYGVIFESMATSKPVMHHRNDSLYPNESLYPMLGATNEEEILKQLIYAINHKTEMEKMGIEANEWFKKEVVEKTIREISNLIREKHT